MQTPFCHQQPRKASDVRVRGTAFKSQAGVQYQHFGATCFTVFGGKKKSQMKFWRKICCNESKQTIFTFKSLTHLWVFMPQSEEQTGTQKKNHSAVSTSKTILLLLQKDMQVHRGQATRRDPSTLPKHRSKPHGAETHQFARNHVPSGTVSRPVLSRPKTTSQTQPHTQHRGTWACRSHCTLASSFPEATL